ncbi:MAG: alpha/beta fold hydrolase [Desulfovibrionaceae bacterium]
MATVCLLLHGLGGTPFDLHWVQAALEKTDITPHPVLLAGHGGTVEAYGAARFAHWTAQVEREYRALAAQGNKVLVCGFSLGGILALHLAQRFPVVGVVALASPMYLCKVHPYFCPTPRLFFISMLAQWRKVEYHPKRSALAREIAPWQGHEGVIFPPQIVDLQRGMVGVRKKLGQVSAPLLFMQARGDTTCNMYNAGYIASHVASKDVRVRILGIEESRVDQHLLVSHVETRDQVAAEVVSFALNVA